MVELFIAKKYLHAKHKINFIKILSLISTVGITIGVAALIIVLSVFNGFGSIVTNILVSFDPHIKITLNSPSVNSQDILETVNSFKEVDFFYKTVEAKALFINDKTFEVVNLKGIETDKNAFSNLESKIISGKFDLSQNKIVIGLALALRLGIRVGDEFSITSAYNIEKTITNLSIPQTKNFLVSGIFESNNRDYDAGYAFTSLNSAQSLFGFGKNLMNIEIRLKDFSKSEQVKEEIINKVGTKNLTIQTWYDFHKQLYNVMLIERWSAYIILCLIIAVATFNIFASLTMTIIEKKRDIGVLRSLGINQRSIKNIFMFNGLLTGLTGTVFGLIIGIAVCYIQINYKIYPLDPMKYIIDSLPVQMRFSDIVVVSLMSIFLSFIAAFYPAKRAAKNIIIDSIKYE